MFRSRLNLDEMEARIAPTIAIEYHFVTPNPSVVVVGKTGTIASKPVSAFADVKVDLPSAPLGNLVGWPPIKVKW